MIDGTTKTVGVLGEFTDAEALLKAAEKIRDAGYTCWDCHSPYPIHGLDQAMGEKRSHLGWIVAGAALFGGGGALLLQWWTSTTAYPLVIAGKPLFSYQAFFPVTFGLAILFAAFGSVFGLFGLIRLRFHHPVFESDRFRKASDDGFFISIESRDPNFDPQKDLSILQIAGAVNVEELKELE